MIWKRLKQDITAGDVKMVNPVKEQETIKINYVVLHKYLINYLEMMSDQVIEDCKKFDAYNQNNITGMACGFELLIQMLDDDFTENVIKDSLTQQKK